MRIILFLSLFFAALNAFADRCGVSGTYDLSGWEPTADFKKAPSYTGTLVVSESNGTYRFEGSADGLIFFGKGLTNDCKSFAFSFSSADRRQYGVTLAIKDGQNFKVLWSYNLPNTSGPGKEIWKKRN